MFNLKARMRVARILASSFRVLIISAALAGLSACQSLRNERGNPIEGSQITVCLEQAQQAWIVLQKEKPGTLAAQNALHVYGRAVAVVVKSLHETEGTDAWGKEMQWGGARPWRLTFEGSANQSPARTLALTEFNRCWLAADVKLRNFDRVIAHDGLGVPVVLAQDDPRRVARPFHPPDGEFLPATAVLEFPDAVPGRPAEARLRFYNPLAVSAVKVGQHPQRLAENLTAALQFSLTDATRDEERPHGPAQSASGEDASQLFFLSRYDDTKVPVVFVHGLRCGPSVWKNSVNELLADPELRRRYQPVCFVYPSQLPVPTSAARLRELLKRSRDTLDPGHHDAGFDRMVLVGHSMGGLLARLQVTDSGTDFWRSFFTATQREVAVQVDAKALSMVKSALFFKPQPAVKTVVFISTPHQGSVIADVGILRAVSRLILFVPKTARQHLQSLTELPPDYIHPALREFHDWGVGGTENLSTKHPYFRALARRRVTVPYHSIIATREAPDFLASSDGVVPYWSAHLEGAASETLVPYDHGCLEKPGTVQAVMKILKDER